MTRTAESIAEACGVPTPFFFARDDEMSQWILLFDRLSVRKRRALLSRLEVEEP